ncbi:MAG: aminotransferase class V-fold PLP-dependent enzyme [Bryobacteraceae bacterium]|nr:aminotransferase class V-fold PLP-dependent enzyme [Bryobacteraceae bacterium]
MHRRQLLRNAACAAALFGLPPEAARADTPSLPAGDLFRRDPEAYWKRIRDEQFLLPGWRAFLNNGSLGLAPKPVLRAVTEFLDRSAGLLIDEYPRWGYETLDEHRRELAAFFGCAKDELALTHNATEAMNIVANGLDLNAGDEVLTTDQEHPGGSCCWRLKKARFGIDIREVKIPLPPAGPEQLADLLVSSIGPRTRVLSFSGITTTTGLIMPVREICLAAREKGVITVVDGAHMNGQTPVNLHDLACDYFAGSPHKWLFTPAGCGVFYAREEMLDRLWVNVATGGWDDRKLKAARFMQVGTNNRAIFEGFIAGLRFLKELGPERVYGRIHQLGRMCYAKARHVPGLELLTPDDDRMFAGLVSFRLTAEQAKKANERCREKRIWIYPSEKTRVSTHIHTRPEDLDVFFDIIRDVTRA